ncbi:29790_t:CDS:2, partial [Racocetra persica]
HLSTHQTTISARGRQTTRRTAASNNGEKERRDEKLITWIVMDLQPFTVVEEESFKMLIRCLNSSYTMPTGQAIKDWIFNEFKNRRAKIITEIVQIPGKFSLSAETWSSSDCEDYMGIMIHYVDSNWKLHHYLLDVIPFTTELTYIIPNILTELKINKQPLALTTDDESEIISNKYFEEYQKQLKKTGFPHYKCAARVLNVAAKHVLDVVDASVEKARLLMTKLAFSDDKLQNELRVLCERKGVPYVDPEIDIINKWKSTYYMLSNLQKMDSAIILLADNHHSIKERYLDTADQEKLREILTILAPVETATKILSETSYPGHGDIRFIFSGLQKFLANYIGQNDSTQSLAASLIYQKIEEYWSTMDTSSMISAVLDPRAKLWTFDHPERGERARDAVQGILDQYINPQTFVNSDENEIQAIRQYFLNLCNPQLATTSKEMAMKELDSYLGMKLSDQNINPLTWWQTYQTEFPVLSRIARDYHTIQASSIACGYAFSADEVDLLISRSLLPSEVVREHLCVRSWIADERGDKE